VKSEADVMNHFVIPTEQEVSADNQRVFRYLREGLGFLPNIFAMLAKSEHALRAYVQFQQRQSLLTKREKEVVNLVISQLNDDMYGQSTHTMIGKLNGFTDDELKHIRMGTFDGDTRIEELIRITREIVTGKGRVIESTLARFFGAGYTQGHVVDLVMTIGEKTILNYIWKIMRPAIDFPLAPEIAPATQ
jgi:alkylhydroperoxidase family enzyme